jgi:hypothetical protein
MASFSRCTRGFESVFEQQMNALEELSDAEAFRRWLDGEIAARLTNDYFSVTLPNEFERNKASGPVWNGFLAAQVALGSHILLGTGTVA